MAETTKINGYDIRDATALHEHQSLQALGCGYGTCSTSASTTAKVVTLAGYVLVKGGYVTVKFTNSVPANATMNINSKGAKNIRHRGSNIKANVIQAGDYATFIYDGTYYDLIAIDRTADFLTDTEYNDLASRLGL